MTNLSKDKKQSIARRAAHAAFEEKYEELKKEEHQIGMELYSDSFDEKTRKQALKMPKNWLNMDGCLRFNCEGYNIKLTVNEPMPVPYARYCSVLANVKGDLAKKAQDYANKKESLKEEYEQFYQKLLGTLSTIRSLKQLNKAWPEGKKFYEQYEEKETKMPPAIRFQEINKTLGIPA